VVRRAGQDRYLDLISDERTLHLRVHDYHFTLILIIFLTANLELEVYTKDCRGVASEASSVAGGWGEALRKAMDEVAPPMQLTRDRSATLVRLGEEGEGSRGDEPENGLSGTLSVSSCMTPLKRAASREGGLKSMARAAPVMASGVTVVASGAGGAGTSG